MAYNIVNNAGLRSLWVLLESVVGPVKAEHGESCIAHKTVRGGREWLLRMARGEYTQYMFHVCDWMGDVDS